MIGQQHQRAADQIGSVLVVQHPGVRDLQMKRFWQCRRVQHRRHQQAHDAATDHRAAFVGAGKGPRIGAGGQRQHRDGAIDRVRPTCGVGDRAHLT